MLEEATPLSSDEPLLSVVSEDGNTYVVKPFDGNIDSVALLVDKLYNFDLLLHNRLEFKRILLSRYAVILDCENGAFVLSNIRSPVDADFTFVFYDSVLSGRHRLVLSVMHWCMHTFDLRRLSLHLPVFSGIAIHRFRKMGLRPEGVKRQGMYNGKGWSDVVLFGVCIDELTEQALSDGSIMQNSRVRARYRLVKSWGS